MIRSYVKFFALVLSVASFQLPFVDNANAQRRDEVIERQINQRHQGRSILDVGAALGLSARHTGRVLKSVIIKASTARGRGQAQLVLDGQPEGWEQQVDNYPRSYTFQVPARTILGRDVRTIEFNLRGNFYVESVAVVLGGDRGEDREVETIERSVNLRTQGNQDIPLRQLLGLDRRYEGRRVETVTFVASSEMGQALAVALINGMRASQIERIGTMPDRYVLRLEGDTTLGYGIRTLQLNVRGNVRLERVGVTLRR